MTRNEKAMMFLKIQSLFLTLQSLSYFVLWLLIILLILDPNRSINQDAVITLSIVSVSLSFVWGIWDSILLVKQHIKPISVVLLWIFVFSMFFSLVFDWLVIHNIENMIFAIVHAVGWAAFTGYIFSVKWRKKLIFVKVIAIILALNAILNAVLFQLMFDDVVYYLFLGGYSVFSLFIFIGGCLEVFGNFRQISD